MRTKLDAIAREQALPPGSILEIEYVLAFRNSYLVGAWLKDIEADLEKEKPLWNYRRYTWNPDTATITFEMEMGNYVSDVETGKIVPQWPDGTFKEPVTKYYASAGYVDTIISLALLAACAALVVRERTIYLREKAIVESDLSPEQKAEALEAVNTGVIDDAGQLVEKVTIGVVVAIIAAAILGGLK